MLNYSLGVENFSLPVSWRELTVGQYLSIRKSDRIKENDLVELLAILMSTSYEKVCSFPAPVLSTLLETIDWFNDVPDLSLLSCPATVSVASKDLTVVDDITMHSWGQKIMLEDLIKENEGKQVDDILDQVMAIYLQPEFTGSKFNLDDLPTVQAAIHSMRLFDGYPIACSLLTQLLEALKTEHMVLFCRADADEIAAGIEDYNMFGIMNSIKSLCNNDITKIDEVLDKPYNTALTFLQMNLTDRKFQRRLRKVLQNNAKP